MKSRWFRRPALIATAAVVLAAGGATAALADTGSSAPPVYQGCLNRATGLLLDHAGIDVSDATRGQVTHLPTVPYVTPRQDALPTPPAGQM